MRNDSCRLCSACRCLASATPSSKGTSLDRWLAQVAMHCYADVTFSIHMQTSLEQLACWKCSPLEALQHTHADKLGAAHLLEVLPLEGCGGGQEDANLASGLVPQPPAASCQPLLDLQVLATSSAPLGGCILDLLQRQGLTLCCSNLFPQTCLEIPDIIAPHLRAHLIVAWGLLQQHWLHQHMLTGSSAPPCSSASYAFL